MLVRFDSDVGGFVMFGDVAVTLLRMAGHSGTVPGAIPADEVTAALERLQEAVERTAANQAPPPEDEDEEGESPVGLRQRAFPLLELLRDAAKHDSGIRWRQG